VKTGTEALEIWIPLGGFRLDRRKGKTPEAEILRTDWLVPALAYDDVAATHPLAEQPCLHRVLATCPHDRVVKLAGLYGLLMATGKVTRAADLPAEPVDTWYREIRLLRNATALWDAIAGKDETALRLAMTQHQAAKGKELFGLARERLARQVTEKVAGGRLELIAPESDQPFTLRIRPARLVDAIWQRFAAEIAGMMSAARCPAPGCGRWFPRSIGRSDRQFCSHACKMRAWRGQSRPGSLRAAANSRA
jgi:predicted RNA-binding Zn ribbon-like protein